MYSLQCLRPFPIPLGKAQNKKFFDYLCSEACKLVDQVIAQVDRSEALLIFKKVKEAEYQKPIKQEI